MCRAAYDRRPLAPFGFRFDETCSLIPVSNESVTDISNINEIGAASSEPHEFREALIQNEKDESDKESRGWSEEDEEENRGWSEEEEEEAERGGRP
jgi:hypothetical protein